MPLSFDDLVPQQQSAAPVPAAPVPSGSLSFDDLVPQKEVKPETPAMGGTAPVPSTLETFFKNLGPYIAGIPGRFADLAKGAVTGEILPQSANMPGGEKQGDIPAVISAAALGTPLSVAGSPMKLAPFKAPTEAALEASKTARYNSPEILNLQLRPEAGPDIANLIRTDLKLGKLDKFNAGYYYDIADHLEKPRFGDNLTIADFQAARDDASGIPPSGEANDRRGGAIVRNAIDNYLGNIPQNHVLSGDAAAANDALVKARADTAALKRSQDVTNALARAESKNTSAHSAGNLENLTKQQLRPIYDVKTGISKRPGFQDYTPEEVEALDRAIFPGPIASRLGNIGRKLGSGGGIGGTHTGVLGFLGAEHFGLDPLTAAAVGYGTQKLGQGFGAIAGRMAASRGNYLGDLLRSRSALANEMGANQQMIPAFWPQLLRVPPAGLGSPSMPMLGVNTNQL